MSEDKKQKDCLRKKKQQTKALTDKEWPENEIGGLRRNTRGRMNKPRKGQERKTLTSASGDGDRRWVQEVGTGDGYRR